MNSFFFTTLPPTFSTRICLQRVYVVVDSEGIILLL